MVSKPYTGQRIDQFLSRMMGGFSRGTIQQWLAARQILLNDAPTQPKTKLKLGDRISCQIDSRSKQDQWQQAQAIPLDIIHKDDDLLVINKPAGLVVHPGAGNPDGTLVNALLHFDPSLANCPRAGIVHRIDKDTTGLLVVARHLQAHQSLVSQLQSHQVVRRYHAVTNGTITYGGSVNQPIRRHPTQRTKMSTGEVGKEAITHYHVVRRFRAHTHITCQLETGRTHQIRVHMQHIGHPLVGDTTYGGRPHLPKQCSAELKTQLQQFPRQALHAFELQLNHPRSGQHCIWTCPLPKDISRLIQALDDDQKHHEHS
jgi:23S rRNA pseudouridine1911/1915/1917 synthase